VARHQPCLAKHQVILHPHHARTLQAMRAKTTTITTTFAATVEQRDLAVYDRVAGLG
jgi:hypothetical protein